MTQHKPSRVSSSFLVFLDNHWTGAKPFFSSSMILHKIRIHIASRNPAKELQSEPKNTKTQKKLKTTKTFKKKNLKIQKLKKSWKAEK